MLILLFSIVRNVISVTSVKCQVLRMFSKCHENFPKIWKFSENLKIFKNSENFQKFWKFSENFPKIWKFSENLKIFRKSKIFPKSENGQVMSPSLWSHVSRVTSLSECSLVVFFKSGSESVSQSVSQSVSEWVTREPIELSGDS